MKKIIFTLCASLSLVSLVSPSFAGSESKLVKKIIVRADEHVKNGSYVEAINELGRALLIDHKSIKANEILSVIAQKNEVSIKNRLNVRIITDLIKTIINLEEKTAYFQGNIEKAQHKLENNGISKRFIIEDLRLIQLNILKSSPNNYFASKDSKEKISYNYIEKELTQERNQLSDQYNYLEKQLTHLQNFQKDIVSGHTPIFISQQPIIETPQKVVFNEIIEEEIVEEKNTEQKEDPVLIELGEIQDVEMEEVVEQKIPDEEIIEPLNTELTLEHEKEIHSLKQELALVNFEIEGFKEELQNKNNRVAKLSTQIIDLALKASQKELSLNNSADEIDSLNANFNDLEARFELGQKILQEKDTFAQELQESIDELNIVLKDEKNNRRKDEQMSKFSLLGKNSKINELSGILSIYREKYWEYFNSAKTNEEDVIYFQEELSETLLKLFDKNEELLKTRDRLTFVEVELGLIKKEIYILQGNVLKHSSKTSNGQALSQNNIQSLHDRIKRIQNILIVQKSIN